MKVKFNWAKANQMVVKKSKERLAKASEYMADEVRKNCPVGTVSHPIYKTGPHANEAWTMRDAGMLKRSIRTVEKWGDKNVYLANVMSGVAGDPSIGAVRVYAGHYLAWYGRIVEFYTPWFRPSIAGSQSGVRQILENG